MTRIRLAIAVCVALGVSAAPAVTSSAATKRFSASLTGAQEVPKKGDPNGSANVTLSVSGGKQLCYDIRPKRIDTPQMAHVHKGRKGVAGAIHVNLFTKAKAPRNGKIAGCVKISAHHLSEISAKPSGFYVNLHTKKYPSGSVRGQLSTKKP